MLKNNRVALSLKSKGLQLYRILDLINSVECHPNDGGM